MFSLSLNDLYLASALVLLLLAIALLVSRRSFTVWQLAFALLSLSAWNLSTYVIGERLFANWVSLQSRLQLSAILLFATGLFNFCAAFPVIKPGRWQIAVSSISSAFVLGLLLTRAISDAVYEGGEIRYIEGRWFAGLTLYVCILALLVFAFLYRAWRNHPAQRSKVRFFVAGVFLFVGSGSLFNLVFPLLGNYDFLIVGRLSCTVAALLFFHAVAKHEFLDITVIINRHVAWGVTLLLLAVVALLVHQLAEGQDWLETVATAGSAIFAALLASPLQKFLLTSARRRFIKGWYEPDEIFRRLGGLIMQESNREILFRKTLTTLDEVFELEEAYSVVAVRDEQGHLNGYRLQELLLPLTVSNALVSACKQLQQAVAVVELEQSGRQQLASLLPSMGESGMVIPFHSPEFLEGILVLGRKSSGSDYVDTDRLFLNNLINYLSPLLYRLTPLDKLEQLYNENKRKLYEAEIQLLRAQKIESIVHATRQCHHEIRTPLNIIRLGLGRIKTMEDLENYKSIAREEINHAIEIADRTLAISEESRQAVRVFTEVNVNEVIQRCLRLIDRSRYDVNLDLQQVPVVQALFSDLQVVITNLIHNSLEAMPQGGTLYFSTSIAGDSVVIRVEDTGEGIPHENRSRVWEPYFSGKGGGVGNTTAGRGWGLTIVNRIIDEHGGNIRLNSEVGVGTSFVIQLPISAAPSTASSVAPITARA